MTGWGAIHGRRPRVPHARSAIFALSGDSIPDAILILLGGCEGPDGHRVWRAFTRQKHIFGPIKAGNARGRGPDGAERVVLVLHLRVEVAEEELRGHLHLPPAAEDICETPCAVKNRSKEGDKASGGGGRLCHTRPKFSWATRPSIVSTWRYRHRQRRRRSALACARPERLRPTGGTRPCLGCEFFGSSRSILRRFSLFYDFYSKEH